MESLIFPFKKSKLYIYFTTLSFNYLYNKKVRLMKNLIIAGLISICLFQSTLGALTCQTGYYDPGASATRCSKCPEYLQSCTVSSGTYVSSITGWMDVSGTQTPYCSGSYYNSKTNNCDLVCSMGCYSCAIDVGFCTTCFAGYSWNNYQCLPAVIGLEAASLALLFISLIFAIIGCCYVNKARK